MKQKTHRGFKKRIKVRGNGTLMMQKAARSHLLTNKSKRQKKSSLQGMSVDKADIKVVKRFLF